MSWRRKRPACNMLHRAFCTLRDSQVIPPFIWKPLVRRSYRGFVTGALAFNKQTTIKWGHKAETVQDEAGLLLCFLDSRRQHRFCGRLRYDIMYEDQIAADTIARRGRFRKPVMRFSATSWTLQSWIPVCVGPGTAFRWCLPYNYIIYRMRKTSAICRIYYY